jgi:hypothetical protein
MTNLRNRKYLLLALWLATTVSINAGECTLNVRVRQPDGAPILANLQVGLSTSEQHLGGIRDEWTFFDNVPCGKTQVDIYAGSTALTLKSPTVELVPGETRTADIVIEPVGIIDVRIVDPGGYCASKNLIHIAELTPRNGREAQNHDRIRCPGRIVVPRGSFHVGRRAEGVAATLNNQPIELPHRFEVGREPVVLVVTLPPPGANIHGRIVDPDGLPVASSEVATDTGEHAWVDRKGRFKLRVDDLPRFVRPSGTNRYYDPPVIRVTDASEELRFIAYRGLPPGPVLEGVVSAKDGRAVSSARVFMSTRCPRETVFSAPPRFPSWAAKTDRQGTFVLPCPQDCPFEVRACGHRVRLAPGECPRDLRFEQPPTDDGGQVVVRIVDSDLEPIASLPVRVGSHKVARTGSDGVAKFDHDSADSVPVRIDRAAVSPEHSELVLVTRVSPPEPGTRPRVDIRSGERVELELQAVPGGTICFDAHTLFGRSLKYAHKLRTFFPQTGRLAGSYRIPHDPRDSEPGVCLFPVAPGFYKMRLQHGGSEYFLPSALIESRGVTDLGTVENLWPVPSDEISPHEFVGWENWLRTRATQETSTIP